RYPDRHEGAPRRRDCRAHLHCHPHDHSAAGHDCARGGAQAQRSGDRMMRLSRRLFLYCSTVFSAVPTLARAQFLHPHEPLDPRKAQNLPPTPLTIESGGKSYRFTVEVAATEHQREVGIMHRTVLAADHGMLFDLHSESDEHFWMRNPFIPLDMLFIK